MAARSAEAKGHSSSEGSSLPARTDTLLTMERVPATRLEELATVWVRSALQEVSGLGHAEAAAQFRLWFTNEKGRLSHRTLATGCEMDTLRAHYYPDRKFFWQKSRGDGIVPNL